MKRRTGIIFLAASTLLAWPCAAQLDLADRALAEGLPEIAAAKIRDYLAGPHSAEEKAAAQLKLAETEQSAGRFEEALEALGALRSNPQTDFCKARALAGLGRWNEARALFHELGEGGGELSNPARLCEAESLRALGRIDDAIAVAETFRNPDNSAKLRLAALYLESGDTKRGSALCGSVKPRTAAERKWRQYLEARLLLAENQPAPALFEFERLLKDPRGLTPNMLGGAVLGMCDARVILHGREAADNVLEDFIAAHPSNPWLGLLFQRLDELYQAEENPSESELQKWAQTPGTPRAAYAAYYLARSYFREKKHDKGLRSLKGFIRDYPNHPLAARACFDLGRMLSEDGKLDQAVAAFDDAMRRATSADFLAEAEIASGQLYFRQREYVLAANAFRNAADRSPKMWQLAIFNAALAWLHQGNYAKFLETYQELSARVPESELRRSLLLEEGLLQARTNDPRARPTLELFIRDFPSDHRRPEAQVALAELAFASNELPRASQYLRAVNETKSNPAATERADYLAIFLADQPGTRDDKNVSGLCEAFLRQHPDSGLLPEVRMKLGQVYFRRENFPDAQTQFELLAHDQPDSPMAETALFLAGRAAMRSMSAGGADRALDLFSEVAKLNGPLKLYARAEQAVAQSRLGHASEAIIIYDNILGASPEPELRFSALCGKGDNLYALGAKQEKSYAAAIQIFDQLAADPNVTPHWRNQALYKKARCLAQQKNPEASLAAFYDVLDAQTKGGAEPEYFWFYKAGFDAAQMLETDQKWSSAVRIYEKLASVEGPRAEEAKGRATQLRLEHFIWDADAE